MESNHASRGGRRSGRSGQKTRNFWTLDPSLATFSHWLLLTPRAHTHRGISNSMTLHHYWAMAARAGPSRLVARAPAQAHIRAASTSTSLTSARRFARLPTGPALTSFGQSARWFASSPAQSKQEEPVGPASSQSGPSEGRSPSQADRASETSSNETSSGKSLSQSGQGPQPQQHSRPKRRSAQEEEDARVFQALHDRDGGGAGNEIVDGQFEKGMTKHTRANQYRVI